MKNATAITVALLVAMSTTASYAQTKKGASEYTPGDRMQDKGTKTSKGASPFTPGHEMQKKGTTTKGASEFTPGDKMNDARKK